jgi:hypothetical protein
MNAESAGLCRVHRSPLAGAYIEGNAQTLHNPALSQVSGTFTFRRQWSPTPRIVRFPEAVVTTGAEQPCRACGVGVTSCEVKRWLGGQPCCSACSHQPTKPKGRTAT